MISSNGKRSTCTNYLPHQIKTQSWNEDNWEVNETSFILTSVLYAIWNQSLNEIRVNHNVRDKFSFVRKMRWVEKPISTFEYRVFWWWNCSISAFYWNNLWSFAYEMASTREEKEILCAVSLALARHPNKSIYCDMFNVAVVVICWQNMWIILSYCFHFNCHNSHKDSTFLCLLSPSSLMLLLRWCVL